MQRMTSVVCKIRDQHIVNVRDEAVRKHKVVLVFTAEAIDTPSLETISDLLC